MVPSLRARVEAWRLRNDELEPSAVVLLLDAIGFNRRISRDRINVARQACRWVASVDDLCSFILRVAEERQPRNLPGYLRTCFNSGDPGTLLRSHKRNEVGQGADAWQDYSADTQRLLAGPYAAECSRIIAGLSMFCSLEAYEYRDQMRFELRRLFVLGRRHGTRKVLLRLVPNRDATEAEIVEALDGAMPLRRAQNLLESVA